jgi:hypothetical protein
MSELEFIWLLVNNDVKKIGEKKQKNKDSMDKTILFLGTLPRTPWATLATLLHLRDLQKIQEVQETYNLFQILNCSRHVKNWN